MHGTRRVTGIALLAATVLAGPAVGGTTGRFEKLFGHYNAIRMTLARDSMRDVAYHAGRLAALAGTLAREARRSGGAGEEVAAQLRAIADTARRVERADGLATARDAFEALSRALLEYRGEAGVEDPVVVLCPLHNTVWLQREGEPVANPYMGRERSRCGEVLSFRTPRWAPARPGRPSPSERPPGA